MEGRKFIETISLQNILSYGTSDKPFPLEPLNVLIGPNASGKSNLIEALSLLQAAPRDLQAPIRLGGGILDWIWKGRCGMLPATVNVTVNYPKKPMALRYRLAFSETGARFELLDEALEDERPTNTYDAQPFFYYRYQEGHPVLSVVGEPTVQRRLVREDMEPDQSILSQRRDPDSYPELTYLANQFQRMRFYREWNLGRYTPPPPSAKGGSSAGLPVR